ncbi:MAG: hypothetical protein ILP09_07995, partial [Oscillospiraceae bacterium]|nr:hypothetical protein [Oscillospiraceae bacterium]
MPDIKKQRAPDFHRSGASKYRQSPPDFADKKNTVFAPAGAAFYRRGIRTPDRALPALCHFRAHFESLFHIL